jgi:hypothetical protein
MGTVVVPPADTGVVVDGAVVGDGAVVVGVALGAEPEPPQAVRTALLTTSKPTNQIFRLISPGYAVRTAVSLWPGYRDCQEGSLPRASSLARDIRVGDRGSPYGDDPRTDLISLKPCQLPFPNGT